MTAGMADADRLRRLTKRSQFLSAARGKRAGRRSLALQAGPAADPRPGIGFTVTKKCGNSPERNRIKRRLRAAVQACADGFKPQHDYVIVGRREALGTPFDQLRAELASVIERIHADKAPRNKANGLGNPRP